MANLQLWRTMQPVAVNYNNIESAVRQSDETNLTEIHKSQIISAFNAGAYDMATEYTWKKAMVRLKEMVGSLGLEFIGDLLQRQDITRFSIPENVLSDTDAINLAERLGMLPSAGAMHLRQAKEQLAYYFSSEATQREDYIDGAHAFPIISDCVKFILRINNFQANINFVEFRDRLLNDNLSQNDDGYRIIENAPLFYLRTIYTILLSAIKKESGAKFEHASANLNLIINSIWNKLGEDDRWNIGSAYKDVVADGNEKAARSLKMAMSKVHGFDYVPENLRSNTFNQAAERVVKVHYDFNNFYNEPSAVRALAALGSVIPKAAFTNCMKAYLCVLMGNRYGVSVDAFPVAKKELEKVSPDRWAYYFSDIICKDEDILYHLGSNSQISRLSSFLKNANLDNLPEVASNPLYKAIVECRFDDVKNMVNYLQRGLRGE